MATQKTSNLARAKGSKESTEVEKIATASIADAARAEAVKLRRTKVRCCISIGLSLVSALLLWMFFVPRFDLVLDIEVPNNVGGKLEWYFNDAEQPWFSERVKSWNEEGRYRFRRVPTSIQSLRFVPANAIGADVLIERMELVTSPVYLPSPNFSVYQFSGENLKSWKLTNLLPGPVLGQFRSTDAPSSLELRQSIELLGIIGTTKSAVGKIWLGVYAFLVLAAVCLVRLLFVILKDGTLGSWLRTFIRMIAFLPVWLLALPFRKNWRSPAILARGAFFLFSISLFAFCAEVLGYFLLKQFPIYESERKLYAGIAESAEDLPRYTGEAYLNYVSTPGYAAYGEVQHNKDGYRGDPIPLTKTPEHLRLLFFGGSTTYGTVVRDPKKTLPAQTGAKLEQSGVMLEGKKVGVEIINAGMDFATSAEFVTQYIMKYRFYKPDVVIVHCGLNDALSADHAGYQPDYTHWRQSFVRQDALPAGTRLLMRSRAFAFIALHSLYYNQDSNDWWVHKRAPDATWYAPDGSERTAGFRNNIETLVREVKADGGQLILMPDRLATYIGKGGSWEQYLGFHEKILKEIAEANKETFAVNDRSIIQRGRYVDGVHLNEEGEGERAAYLAEIIKSSLVRKNVS